MKPTPLIYSLHCTAPSLSLSLQIHTLSRSESTPKFVVVMVFAGTTQKCMACDKSVYLVDKLSADNRVYHKACFRCHHCKGTLKLANYNSFEGVLYCRPHFNTAVGELEKVLVTPTQSQNPLAEPSPTPSSSSSTPSPSSFKIKFLLAVVVVVAVAAAASAVETGRVVTFGGLDTYISGPEKAAAAVILATDIFGYERPQFREIVDKVGRAGFFAVAPDFFRGSAFVHGYNYTAWVSAHPPENSLEDAKAVVEALNSNNITNIGGVGFCWGGKLVVELLTGPLIQTGVLIHPSSTNVSDIEGIKAPVAIFVGDLDTYTNVSLATQFEVALKAKPEVESWVKIFPGQRHGWALQYDTRDATAVKSAEEAHNDMLRWLRSHLPAVSSAQQLVPPTFLFLLILFLH